MSSDTRIEIHDETRPEEASIVRRGLADFNRARGPFDRIEPLSCFARSPEGEVLGGAVGQTWGACAELGQLWVAESSRRAGLGTRLLSAFEARARTRGCRIAYLDAFSSQTPDFYRARGYTVLCQFEGFPDDHVYYVMSKSLGDRPRGERDRP